MKIGDTENWKRVAWIGVVYALAILIRFIWKGTDPGTGMVTLTLGFLGIAGGWHGLKRATWKPREAAEAEAIRNGNGPVSDVERRRADDDYGSEFAGR